MIKNNGTVNDNGYDNLKNDENIGYRKTILT